MAIYGGELPTNMPHLLKHFKSVLLMVSFSFCSRKKKSASLFLRIFFDFDTLIYFVYVINLKSSPSNRCKTHMSWFWYLDYKGGNREISVLCLSQLASIVLQPFCSLTSCDNNMLCAQPPLLTLLMETLGGRTPTRLWNRRRKKCQMWTKKCFPYLEYLGETLSYVVGIVFGFLSVIVYVLIFSQYWNVLMTLNLFLFCIFYRLSEIMFRCKLYPLATLK